MVGTEEDDGKDDEDAWSEDEDRGNVAEITVLHMATNGGCK